MNVRTRCPLPLLAAVAMASSTLQADIAVGDRRAETIHVEDASTLSCAVQSAQGRLYKTGDGTLTLDQAALAGSPVTVEALAGAVAISPAATATPSVPAAPAALFEKAALWLDSSELASLQLENEANPTSVGDFSAAQGIAVWNDRRDIGAAQRAHPYMVSSNALGTVLATIGLPSLYTTNGVAGIHFGGYGSGRYMDLYSKSGAQANFSYSVAHVFFVYTLYNSWGYMMGTRTGDAFWFNNGTRTLAGMNGINSLSPGVLRSAYAGSIFLNGRWAEQFSTPSPARASLLREDFMEGRPTMNALFATKAQTASGQTGSKAGCGGDFLHEAAVFTNVLSEAEIAQIEDYLMRKWAIPQPGTVAGATRQGVVLASGATLEADISGDTLPVGVAGAGTLVKKGAGTLSLGNSGGEEFTGSVDLQAGSLLSRGGRLPPVQARGGVAYATAAYQKTNNTDARDANGVKLTKGAASNARTFAKTGAGDLRVNAIDADVAKISVEGGALVLEAPAAAPLKTVAADVAVVVTNGNFEMPAEFGWQKNLHALNANQVSNGWWRAAGAAFFTVKETFSNWSLPEGSHCLRLNSGSAAFTRIRIPVAGCYEISFRHTGRNFANNISYNRNHIDVCLEPASSGRGYADYAAVATFLADVAPYPRTRYRVTVEEAGDYVFGFRCRALSGLDNYSYIDDVAVEFVADAGRDDIWDIPNGDFEQIASGAKVKAQALDYLDADGNQVAANWTLSKEEGAGAVIGLARWESFGCNSGHVSYFVPGEPHFTGSAQLHLLGNRGTAQTTFTPPAGRWRLQARVAKTVHQNTYTASAAGATAEISIGGAAAPLSLGTVSNTVRTLSVRRWPTAFETDGATPVTLTVRGMNAAGYAVLDDFALAADGAPGIDGDDELIREGGFERGSYGTAWTGYTEGSSSASGKHHGHGALIYPNSIYAPTAGEGRYGVRLQQDGGVWQTVDFPEAGTYRLRFLLAPRPGSGYGWNSVRAWIQENGVKRELGKAIVSSESWQEYAFTFDVATPGPRRIGLNGIGRVGCPDIATYGDQRNCDHTSCIDAVSLKRVREAFAATPAVADGFKCDVRLAAGTRLVLDYPGTLKVSALSLGGTGVRAGVVCAADYPEYLSGRGAIEVVPNATVIIMR